MSELESIREFVKGDRYATEATQLVIEEASKGHSVVSLVPDSRHLNAVGSLMGAVYYTMADFAFAVAENCDLDSPVVTVTQDASINFLKAWRGGAVRAEAEMIKDGRSTCFYEVKCSDMKGNLLALVTLNGFKVNKK